ncbi:hypothetical protein ACIBKZ_22465 [Streptomyces sp. NPDC050421]|uniref:hypothetical protein n=1 Tax=Streptomyces sp. NPDC050421 TaxID=3365613 RepID=UPI0037B60475
MTTQLGAPAAIGGAHPHRTDPPEEHLMPDTTPTTLTIHCCDIELSDGENLKALGTGNYLELAEPTAGMEPGTWQVVDYHGEFQDRATMRPVSVAEVAELRRSESEKLAAFFGGNR